MKNLGLIQEGSDESFELLKNLDLDEINAKIDIK
jgi:hypothetical protein